MGLSNYHGFQVSKSPVRIKFNPSEEGKLDKSKGRQENCVSFYIYDRWAA